MLELLSKIESLIGFDRLYKELSGQPATASWADQLRDRIQADVDPRINGNLPKWLAGIAGLPRIETRSVDLGAAAITANGSLEESTRHRLREGLLQLHPWRKGPFDLFGLEIDSEWRSDLKWERVAPHVELAGKTVLDVGCGNGYYGYRMLAAGAARVIGLDPMVLFVMQAAALRQYLGQQENYVLPGSDLLIPAGLGAFDSVFSMGVLYHRTGPIDHLRSLWNALKPDGELVLETLVTVGDANHVLVPQDRYAKMRNVWFLPSVGALERWLAPAGFRDISTVDVTAPTRREQRATEWMHFESLADFLDPDDPGKTIEGHPAPIRAVLTARRR